MKSISLIALAVAFGLVTGCATAEAPPEPPSGRGISISLPLDAYAQAPEEQERADRAQAALERDCLSRFGLTWPGPGETALLAGGQRLAAQRAERFGLVDGDIAARYGYHPPPWSSKAERKGERHEHEQPSGRVGSVLFGQVAELGGKQVPQCFCQVVWIALGRIVWIAARFRIGRSSWMDGLFRSRLLFMIGG